MRATDAALRIVAVFAIAASARAGVLVVDVTGSGSFTEIQAAVDAAIDADTILVKPGRYTGFAIDGKSLTVVGEAGVRPVIRESVLVSHIGPSQSVTLARLDVAVTSGPELTGLRLSDCAGPVRCVESDFTGRKGINTVSGGAGVSISRVSDLAFSACSIAGGHGRIATWCTIDYVSRGGTGVVASSSSLAIHDSIVSGGDGGDGGYYTAEGGNALNVYAGTAQAPGDALVFTSRSSLRGGSGGGNSECVIGCPSDGGDAFYLNTAVGWILDSIVAGGAEGALGARMCPADPGQQYPADDPLTIEAASLGLSIPSIAREGQFVTATFIGPPGARVFVNDQTTTTFEASLSWRGVLLSPFDTSGPPAREIKWGVIPASGVLTRTYAVPTLPAGEEAHTRYLQAYRVGPDGRITLGSFRTLTVLDSAF